MEEIELNIIFKELKKKKKEFIIHKIYFKKNKF